MIQNGRAAPVVRLYSPPNMRLSAPIREVTIMPNTRTITVTIPATALQALLDTAEDYICENGPEAVMRYMNPGILYINGQYRYSGTIPRRRYRRGLARRLSLPPERPKSARQPRPAPATLPSRLSGARLLLAQPSMPKRTTQACYQF